MITKEKIDIFLKYGKDADVLARIGTKKERELMNLDWSTIDSFIQDIALIKSGISAKKYTEDIIRKLDLEC